MEAIMNLWNEEVDQPLPESGYAPKSENFIKEFRSFLAFVTDVYSSCDWIDKKEWGKRGCFLQYVGYRLLHLLELARELFDLRLRLLCDEHCNDFQQLVKEVDDRCLVSFSKLIWEVERYWQATGKSFSALDDEKAELVRALQEIGAWMDAMLRNGEVQKMLSEKCREWNLHYEVLAPDDNASPVWRYFRSAFRCLILLAIPSHWVVPKDMAALFRNGFNTFCQNGHGKDFKEAYALRVKKAFGNLNLPDRLERLEQEKAGLQERVTSFLSGFRISYNGLDDEEEKARFCRKLYARLNRVAWKSGAQPAALPPMTDKDIFKYFLGKILLQVLHEEIRRLENRVKRQQAADGHPLKDSDIFDPLVDERCLAKCFCSLYEICKKEDMLKGNWDDIDFAVYLFILIEKEGWGKPGFGHNSRAPFYRFIQENVIKGLGKGKDQRRTFHNRLEGKFKKCRDYFLDEIGRQEGRNPALENNDYFQNFQSLQNIFHTRTSYGNILRKSFK